MYNEKKNITWLKPLGFNNTYIMTMRRSDAEKLGIETFSDLAKHAGDLSLVVEGEFLEREDGYKGLQKVYGMNFKATVQWMLALCIVPLKTVKQTFWMPLLQTVESWLLI